MSDEAAVRLYWTQDESKALNPYSIEGASEIGSLLASLGVDVKMVHADDCGLDDGFGFQREYGVGPWLAAERSRPNTPPNTPPPETNDDSESAKPLK